MTEPLSPGETVPRVVVIGVGNLLLRDEGIGIHVIRALERLDLPGDVRVMDGGTSPEAILFARAREKLVIVDAARAGGKPGMVYRFHPQDLATMHGSSLSAHEMGVAENLHLMGLTAGHPEEIVIIGIEPKEIDWGTELSPELREKLPAIVN
ncbi:MAG: hydrogenase maturation protease, partial [Dehalococcoidales bacterium]|nr:hydrogenase maturation protease [Dehalococcoidales bacterium]